MLFFGNVNYKIKRILLVADIIFAPLLFLLIGQYFSFLIPKSFDNDQQFSLGIILMIGYSILIITIVNLLVLLRLKENLRSVFAFTLTAIILAVVVSIVTLPMWTM